MIFKYNNQVFCGSLGTLLGDVAVYLGSLNLVKLRLDSNGVSKYTLGEESITIEAISGVDNYSLRALLTGEVLERLTKEYQYYKETGDDFWDWQ